MTREEFMNLFGYSEYDMHDLRWDEIHSSWKSWFECAKSEIKSMQFMLCSK